MDTGIIRDASADEKKDFIEIGQMTFDQLFRKELSAKEAEYTRLHKPYDRVGAIHDFKDKIEAVVKKAERQYGDGAGNFIKYKDVKIDLEVYGKPERFNLLESADCHETKLLDGMKTDVVTGKWLNYQCVNHRGRISVFMPLDLWEKSQKEAKAENKAK